jgi:hypothetical protein
MADAAGNKTGRETRLIPGPSRVEYPNAALGDVIETADGRVVVQVSGRDPRRRAWVWSNFGPSIQVYERQYRWLEQLVARRRRSLNLPQHVYLFDGVTGLLNITRSHTTVVGAQSSSILTIPTLPASINPVHLRNGVVEVLPATGGSSFPYERRSILTATSTSLTLEDPLSGSLGNSEVLLTWSEPVWWKARVLDTTRELQGDGGSVKYGVSRFQFVIDESTEP